MSKHDTPDTTYAWLLRWAAATFGSEISAATADIMSSYGTLLMRRKYEWLNCEYSKYPYSTRYYDELEFVAKQWADLLEQAQSAYDSLPSDMQSPFFQMVLHPVKAGKVIVDMYNNAELNSWRWNQRCTSTNDLANSVSKLVNDDAAITEEYHSLEDGKWDEMMSQNHYGYTNWQQPNRQVPPNVTFHAPARVPDSGIMGVSIQGSNSSAPGDPDLVTLKMDPYLPARDRRYLGIFTRDNGTFSYRLSSNASYITLSKDGGNLTAPGGPSDARIFVGVDWKNAPVGIRHAAVTVEHVHDAINVTHSTLSGSQSTTVLIPLHNTEAPSDFSGCVESGYVVSMEAEHYTSAEPVNGISAIKIPAYGRTLSALKTWPVNSPSLSTATAPEIRYRMHTFTSRNNAQVVVALGASLNYDPSRPLKFAFSIDGAAPKVVQPVPDTPMGEMPKQWSNAVIAGGWTSKNTVSLPAGTHTLSIWLLEPGVVMQKVIVDLGGYASESSLGPPESISV